MTFFETAFVMDRKVSSAIDESAMMNHARPSRTESGESSEKKVLRSTGISNRFRAIRARFESERFRR